MTSTAPPCDYPFTYRPDQIVGYVNGRPIFPIAGGSAPAGEGGAGDGATGDGTPPAGAPAGTPPADAPKDDGKPPAAGRPMTPEGLERELTRARNDAASNRTRADAAEASAAEAATKAVEDVTAKFLAALGKTPDGKEAPPTAEQMTREVGELRTRTTAAESQLAVYKAAGRLGANPDKLTDSASFLRVLDAIPADAKDRASKIEQAVKDALASNPDFGATAGRAPVSSGVPRTGGAGEGRNAGASPPSLDAATKAHYSR